MDKSIIGLLFIFAGSAYGSLIFDGIYNATLGYLVQNGWVKLPEITPKDQEFPLGRKPTIILYSFILIIIGIFILWNRNL